jgi:hypothetical protein
MGAKTNRLLMLLVGAAIAGCASQTDRSSSGGGAAQAQVESEKTAAPPPPPPPPPYSRKKEPVSMLIARWRTPRRQTRRCGRRSQERAGSEFPVTKYELPEDEEVEDLGPVTTNQLRTSKRPPPSKESSVGETTEYAEEEADEEIEELGSLDDESVSEEQEAAANKKARWGKQRNTPKKKRTRKSTSWDRRKTSLFRLRRRPRPRRILRRRDDSFCRGRGIRGSRGSWHATRRFRDRQLSRGKARFSGESGQRAKNLCR